MGIRFRKSFKIASGIKLNLNKKSAGITFGTRGAHYTINSKGKKTASVGIPGTGLSYTSTSGGSGKCSSKRSNNNSVAAAPNNNSNDNGQKWYHNPSYIILLLVFFFPVGLFLMWKYTNWNKYVKIGISAFFALALLIPSSSSELEKITISADTTRSYDRNEDILIEYSTEPADYSLDKYDFEKTGGSIKISDDKIYFSSLFTGTYEIYAEKSGVKSNVITITIKDEKTSSDNNNEKQENADTPKEETTDNTTNESEVQSNELQQDDTSNKTPENTSDNQVETPQENVSQETPVVVPNEPVQAEPEPSTDSTSQETLVWVSEKGKKYHSHSGCSNMENPTQVTKSEAEEDDKEPCKKCY